MNKKGHFSNCLHSQKAARYAVFLLIITIAVRLSIFLIISQKNKKKYIYFLLLPVKLEFVGVLYFKDFSRIKNLSIASPQFFLFSKVHFTKSLLKFGFYLRKVKFDKITNIPRFGANSQASLIDLLEAGII